MIRFYLALWLAKLSIPALKLTGHNATDFPGSLALKICPDFLKYVRKPQRIIGVTGTNGKTTTANLTIDMLRRLGVETLNNSRGSNINSGIATALINGVTLGNREKFDTAVLEIDERSAARVFPYVQPDFMIVTNLSRDSIMRNAHPEYIKWLLGRYIPAKTTMILNADDLISSSVAPDNPRVYFGLERMDTDVTECRNLIDDLRICPVCHHKLEYVYRRYSNIGRAHCTNCDFRSPDYDFSAADIRMDEMKFTLHTPDGAYELPLISDRIVNLYNEVAMTTLMTRLGFTVDQVKAELSNIQVIKTRFNYEQVGDMRVYNVLGKGLNAYAESRVYETIVDQPGDKELIMYINDLGLAAHWSENISWIYDTDFETLCDDKIKKVVFFQDRGLDYKMRLLLAGFPEDRIVHVMDADEAIRAVDIVPGMNYYVIYGADPGSFKLGNAQAKKLADRLRKAAEGVTA
ncbi:MAG: DUF1727 domain-containing protein [Mogibacterium sp.]|nr:DUF1727 domain-containing protein [Mogibacterium sp.]